MKGNIIMKKLFAILLATVMVCTTMFCVPAFAAPIAVNNAGNSSQNVNVSVSETLNTVYAVDIEWGTLTFAYSTEFDWVQSNHSYTEKAAAWNQTSNTITVTNHSNQEVTVKTVYAPDNAKQVAGVTVSVTGESVADTAHTLTAGVENGYANADSTEITVSIGDSVPTTKRANTTVVVGTITITLG